MSFGAHVASDASGSKDPVQASGTGGPRAMGPTSNIGRYRPSVRVARDQRGHRLERARRSGLGPGKQRSSPRRFTSAALTSYEYEGGANCNDTNIAGDPSGCLWFVGWSSISSTTNVVRVATRRPRHAGHPRGTLDATGHYHEQRVR